MFTKNQNRFKKPLITTIVSIITIYIFYVIVGNIVYKTNYYENVASINNDLALARGGFFNRQPRALVRPPSYSATAVVVEPTDPTVPTVPAVPTVPTVPTTPTTPTVPTTPTTPTVPTVPTTPTTPTVPTVPTTPTTPTTPPPTIPLPQYPVTASLYGYGTVVGQVYGTQSTAPYIFGTLNKRLGGQKTLDIKNGHTVVFRATPDKGIKFSGWSGDCTGTSVTCMVNDINRPVQVVAVFGAPPKAVLVEKDTVAQKVAWYKKLFKKCKVGFNTGERTPDDIYKDYKSGLIDANEAAKQLERLEKQKTGDGFCIYWKWEW